MLKPINTLTRRLFLKMMIIFGISASISESSEKKSNVTTNQNREDLPPANRFGIDHDGISRVYVSSGKKPEENIKGAINLFGGIRKIINQDDIVIIKPNAQWWNQGTSNTNNLKGLIESILDINNFMGEIIIAENHHYAKIDSRGWTTNKRNGDYNLNELINYFHSKGHTNVTKYHWVDAGPNPRPREGNASAQSSIITEQPNANTKDGYVWLKEKVYTSEEGRQCMMTYPFFTSSYSGKKIDLKRGVIDGDQHLDNLKLINFSCLNHHGTTWGVTASIKNLMGIVDMTCGYQGVSPEGYYNTHFIGSESFFFNYGMKFRYWGRKYGFGQELGKTMQSAGTFNNQYTGAALGYWMRHIRMPDLNILAAEYVGWGSRTDPSKRTKSNIVAVSTDPVALDYYGAKEILLNNTPHEETTLRQLNNPDQAPFNLFLKECQKQGIGCQSFSQITVVKDVSA